MNAATEKSLVSLPPHERKGSRLCLSTVDGPVEVEAPEPWIALLVDADENGRTLDQLVDAAQASWGPTDFQAFVVDLMDRGLVALHRANAGRASVEFFQDAIGTGRAVARTRVRWPSGAETNGWGRGAAAELAEARSLGEAVERHAFLWPTGLSLARGIDLPERELKRAFVAYSDEQYGKPDFPLSAYAPEEERYWTRSTCLSTGSQRWMPAEAVFSASALPAGHRQRRCAAATTSGFACSPSLDDAIDHALFELIERDAFMRHWIAQRAGVRIPTGTLPSSAQAGARELTAAGCDIHVQCLTLGVAPVWLAFAQHEAFGFTCAGAAAGRYAEVAVERAVDEAHVLAMARIAVGEQVLQDGPDPLGVDTPEGHAAVYGMRQHFRRADALLQCSDEDNFALAVATRGGPTSARHLFEREARSMSMIDFSETSKAFDAQGRPLRTVRVIAPSLAPMTFGARLLPLAFGKAVPTAFFPHPLA